MAPPALLLDLLRTPGPSGAEDAAAAVWRSAASEFAEVRGDVAGNSFARVAGTAGGPSLALLGHVDEIGFSVTHVDEHGFLSIRSGPNVFTPSVLLGQRVEILGRDGPVAGVVAAQRDRKRDEDKRAVSMEDLVVDVGAQTREQALELVALGDPGVPAGEPLELAGGRLASRALDNRLGAYVVLEAARRLAAQGGGPGDVTAVATTSEEVGDYNGARAGVWSLDPDVALAVDVTPATDVPGGDCRDHGPQRLGGGVSIARGAGIHRQVWELLVESAESEGIPWETEVTMGRTMTDADAAVVSRGGVASAVLSIPTRFLHTPVEVVDLDDVEAAVRLCAAFAKRLEPGLDLSR